MKEELTLNVSRIWAIGMQQVTPVNTSSTSEWAFEKEGCAEWAWGGNREHHSGRSWIRSYVLRWEVVGQQQCMGDEEKAGEGKNGQWVIPEMGRAEGTSRSIIIIIIIIAKGPLRQQKAEGTPTRIFTIMLHNRWVTWNCRKVHNNTSTLNLICLQSFPNMLQEP